MAGAAGPAAGGGGGAGDAKPRSSSSFAGAPGGRPSSTSASAGTRYSSDYSRFSHIGAGDEGSDDDSAAPGEWERERGARAGTGPGEGAGTRDAKAGGGQQAIEVHGAQGGGASDVAVAATAGAAHGAPAGGGSAGAAGAPGASAGAAGGEHADNCAIVADAVDSLRPGASGSECNDADSLEDQVERHTAPPGAAPGGGCSTAAHTQSTSTSAGGDSKAVREAAEGATAVEDGDAGPSDHEVEPSYPGYDGERCADNRPHGYGVYRYKDGAVYEGYWSNGQKCSWGRQNYANGKVYEGDWRDGKWDGQGFACFPNGTKYTGGWRGNKRDGHGKQEFADGSVYEGNYCEDRREGHGKMTFADGRTYNGDWKADKWWGEGTATFPNGGRYNGGWRDDRREGTGKETFAAGGSYEGGWVSDRREGLGREVWPNGDVYEGEYVQGQMEGHGICRYADGRVYEGEWRKGKWWGEGTAIFANGNKYSGGWRASRREGRGKQVYHSDNGSYDGDWLNDKKHGRGLEIWGNGDMYEGEYKDGHRDGHGVFTSHTGEVYEGKFKEGKRHGQGKLTKPDLTEQWGVWHHGAFQGKQLSDRASSARAHLQAKLKQRKQAKNGGDVDGNAGDASVEAGSAGGGSASAAETGRHKRAAEAAEAAEAAAEAAAAELLAEEENTKKAAEDKKKRKQQKAKDKKRAKAEAERAKAEAERAKEAELAKSEAEKTKAAAEAKKVAEAAQAKASEKAPEARKDAEELKPAAQAVVKAPAPGAAAAVVNEGAPAHASAPQISAAISKIGALNLGATTNAVHTAADNSDEWEAVGRGKKKKNKNRVTDAAGDNLKPPNAPMPPAFGPRAGPDISGSKFQGRAASVPPLGGATSSRHVAAQHQLAHAKQQGVPRPLSLEAGGRAVPPMTKLATMPAGHDLGGGSHGQPGSEQNSRTKIADHSQAAQDVQKTRTDLSSLQHPRSAPARTVPADMPVSTTTDLSRSEPAARLSGTRSAGPALQAAEKQQAAMAGGAHVQQASGGRGPPSATQVNSQAGRSHAATPNVPMNADGGPSHAMPQLQPGTASQNYGYSLFGGVVGGLGASFGGGTSASTFGTTAGGASYSLFGGPGLGSVANPPAHLQPSAAKMHQHQVADVSSTARGSESARSRPGEGTQRLSQAEQQQASVHQQQQHHHQQQRQMQPQPQQQPPQHAQRQQQRQQLLQQQQQQQAPDLTQATVQHHQQLVQQQPQMGVAYGLRMPQVLPGAHAFNAVPDVGAKGTMFGAVHPDSARVQFMHARDVSSSGGAGSAGGVRAPANMHAPAPPSTVLGTGGGRDASTQQHMQAGVYAGHTQGAHPEFRASAQVIQAHAPFGQAIQHRPQGLMYGQYSGSAAGGVMHSTGPGVHVHVGGGPVAAHLSLPAVGHVQPSARPQADAQMNLSGASAPNQDASSYGPGV